MSKNKDERKTGKFCDFFYTEKLFFIYNLDSINHCG
jgi:hypothetical protein